MTSDVYSKKDITRNLKIDIKQRQILFAIFWICLIVFLSIATFYYFDTHTIVMAKSPPPTEPPAIVSNAAHSYDASRPPDKQ